MTDDMLDPQQIDLDRLAGVLTALGDGVAEGSAKIRGVEAGQSAEMGEVPYIDLRVRYIPTEGDPEELLYPLSFDEQDGGDAL